MRTSRPRGGFRHVVCGLVIPLLMVSSFAALGIADDDPTDLEIPRNIKVTGLKRWYADKKKERLELIARLRAEADAEGDREKKEIILGKITQLMRYQFMPPHLDLRHAAKDDVGIAISRSKNTDADGEVHFRAMGRDEVRLGRRKGKICEVWVYTDGDVTDELWVLWSGSTILPHSLHLYPPYEYTSTYYPRGMRQRLVRVAGFREITDSTGKKRRVPWLVEHDVPKSIDLTLPKPVVD